MQRTPLDAQHRALGARTAPFAGWEMPIQYSGIVDEHRTVRRAAGLFDLSHMGELWVTGASAGDALAFALVTDPRALPVGRAHYSMCCAPDGGILDDLVVYRLGETRWLVVPNAGNRERIADALAARFAGFDVQLEDRSLQTALLAVQGPAALAITAPHVTGAELHPLRYYGVVEAAVCGVPAVVARTGYTGEDGFELFVPWDAAERVWTTLLAAGAAHDLKPIGLGARDTLRLEAGMPLYGHELTTATTPFDAGLGRVVRFEKAGDFVGRTALAAAAAAPPTRRLAGLRLRERGIPREGMAVLDADGRPLGAVTSGTMSPTLGQAIAMAYVTPAAAEPGTAVQVQIRDSRAAAEVVALPFYRRERARSGS